MIPATVSPSVSASAANLGVLFPPLESASADVAEFDQLMGEFAQATTIQSAISSPLNTKTTGLLNAAPASVEEEMLTPEGLLSSLAVGAGLALQPTLPQPAQTNAVFAQVASEKTAQGVGGVVTAQGTAQPAVSSEVIASVQPALPQPAQTNAVFAQVASEYTAQGVGGVVTAQGTAQPAVSSEVIASVQPALPQPAQTNAVFAQVASEYTAQGVGGVVTAQGTAQPAVSSEVIASVQPALPQPAQTNAVFAQVASEKTAQGLTTSLQSTTVNLVLGATATQGTLAMVGTKEVTQPTTLDALGTPSLIDSPALTKTPSTTSPAILAANALTSPVPSMNTSSPTAPISPLTTDNTALQAPLMQTETELTQSMPILGENRALVFAAQSATTSVMASGVMQAASTTTDTSPSMNQANAFAVIAANLATAANTAAQEQTKDQSTERQGTPFSEESVSDLPSESSSDDFSVTLAGSLTSSTTQSPILASPLNMRQPQWTQDVSQRVQVMVNQSMNELEVRLDPLDLGPMKIKLALDEQQKAHVTLSAAHGLTRDMLENALPRLKELLAQEGIELASATVNSGQEQSRNEQDRSQSSRASTSELAQDAVTTSMVANKTVISENIVDQFV